MKNDDKWMVVYKDGLVAKIGRFFKKLFKRKDKYIVIHQEQDKPEEISERKEKFIEEIKVDSKTIDDGSKKEAFLQEVDGNRSALSILSTDRLKALEKYYDDVIAKKENEIKRLQNNT